MHKSGTLLLLFLASHHRFAQPENSIRAARTQSNNAIARHDANGIVRDMLPDYSLVTGRWTAEHSYSKGGS